MIEPKTVLIAEDEPVVRRIASQFLTRAGYRVIAALDGADAIARLGWLEEPIDVVVSDVLMPNISGVELAEWVMDRMPEVGVVLVSAFSADTLGLEHILARGAIFISKPFNAAGLELAVRQARLARPRNGQSASH